MGAIYLIRHGQASFGKSDYDNLSPTGLIQPTVLGDSLKHRIETVDAVVTGSMKRHKQTADGCLDAMELDLPQQEDSRWNEYDHEQVIERFKPMYKNKVLMKLDLAKRGNPRRDFQKMFSGAIQRWLCGEHDADYAETWPQFQQRSVSALKELISQLGASKTALVFTSGGCITAVAQELLKIPQEDIFQLNWTLANCGITKIIYSERGVYLSTLNEHVAFEGQHKKLITYR